MVSPTPREPFLSQVPLTVYPRDDHGEARLLLVSSLVSLLFGGSATLSTSIGLHTSDLDTVPQNKPGTRFRRWCLYKRINQRPACDLGTQIFPLGATTVKTLSPLRCADQGSSHTPFHAVMPVASLQALGRLG